MQDTEALDKLLPELSARNLNSSPPTNGAAAGSNGSGPEVGLPVPGLHKGAKHHASTAACQPLHSGCLGAATAHAKAAPQSHSLWLQTLHPSFQLRHSYKSQPLADCLVPFSQRAQH